MDGPRRAVHLVASGCILPGSVTLCGVCASVPKTLSSSQARRTSSRLAPNAGRMAHGVEDATG